MTARKSEPFAHCAYTRMRRFFEENPDEELTLEQMCMKFDIKLGVAREYVNRLGLQRASVYRKPAQQREGEAA